jgi:hypothetical protein
MLLVVDLLWQLLRRPIRMLGPICSLIKSITVRLSTCMVSILLLFHIAGLPSSKSD